MDLLDRVQLLVLDGGDDLIGVRFADRPAVVALVEKGARGRLSPEDVRRALHRLERQQERFGLVFLDPPYEADLMQGALTALGTGAVLTAPGLVIAQHLTKRAPAHAIGVLRAYRTRRFGETTLTFLRGPAYDAPSETSPAGES